MSYQEIADVLRVSPGKVKTDIHRGREALKTLLSGDHGRR
jgi:DNA-directed RNA polymerase specialized sigma24 family protein